MSALSAAGAVLGLDGAEVARRMLMASAQAIGALVAAVCKDYSLQSPRLIAVGGGAGGVARYVAKEMNLECFIPEHAEVISSIGDALSFVLVERERSVIDPTLCDGEALDAPAEGACPPLTPPRPPRRKRAAPPEPRGIRSTNASSTTVSSRPCARRRQEW